MQFTQMCNLLCRKKEGEEFIVTVLSGKNMRHRGGGPEQGGENVHLSIRITNEMQGHKIKSSLLMTCWHI